MKIAIIGARGCVGSALIQKLLNSTEHTIIASFRRDEKTGITHNRVIWKRINLYDDLGTEEFINGADVVVYLVHSLLWKKFRSMDRSFADRTGEYAAAVGIKKIVYLGGVIPDKEHLSPHLKSRKETGEYLAKHGVPVAEVRASIILGAQSASYQMIYWLSRRLPVIIMPKWGSTKCSPIALEDAVDMLATLIERDVHGHEVFEIGGESMGYDELVMRNGKIVRGARNVIKRMPLFPITIAAWVIQWITKVPRPIVAALIGSLKNDSMVTHDRFRELLGKEPIPVDATLAKLARIMKKSK